MDILNEHVSRIGGFDVAFLVAITCGIIFTFLVFVIPAKDRSFFLLVLLSFCQAADKFEAVGIVPTLCKVAVAPLAIFLVIVALVECRARIRLSTYFAAWLATAAWAVAWSVERAHHWELGLREIEIRPLVGLFGTGAYSAIDKGWNAHNAFIQLIYTGGLALAVPTCLLYLLGLYFGIRVYLRAESVFTKSTIGYLVLLQGLLISHGLVNDALFYPTYASSFMVVVLCFFFRRLYFEPQYRM